MEMIVEPNSKVGIVIQLWRGHRNSTALGNGLHCIGRSWIG